MSKKYVDLTSNYRGLYLCYLVDEQIRVTSESFKVYIPSLMDSIQNDGQDSNVNIKTKDIVLNEDSFFKDSINISNYIIAENFTHHTHRLDGWIPKFNIEKMVAQTGSFGKQDASSTKGVTDPGGPGPHTHSISKALTLNSSSISSIEFSNIVMTNSFNVDYQELNNKFMKKGHKMIGAFVEGEEFKFVILAIYGATPRLTEYERSGNSDNPDTSLDGNTNPAN